MKKFLLSIFLISTFLLVISACSSKDKKGSDGPEGDNLNDSLAQIITPEEINKGKKIYKDKCQRCHQNNGKGIEGAFPSLTDTISDIHSIVNGVEGSVMIAYKNELSNTELIDLLNYVNNSWGKKFGRTSPEEIQDAK